MKKHLLLFLLITTLSAGAQTDSSMQLNTLAIQIRDAKFLVGTGVLHADDTLFKVTYDSVSAKIRRDPTAIETNNLNIPVRPKALLEINKSLRMMQYSTGVAHFVRLTTGFRGITGTANLGRSWLVIRMDALDASETTADATLLQKAVTKILGEQ
jgi:hypothetical protein